jgi:predicted TIM-barrel fold metal-dependent hydrolase
MMGGVMLFIGNLRIMGNILLSRFLERHPKLKVVSVESGAGWVPYLLEAMEYMSVESRVKFDVPLTEIFRRQIYVCTFFERKNYMETMRQVGVDNLLWESDFPHPACLYPGSLEYMDEVIAEMTQEQRIKVFNGNARKVYGLPID